MTKTKINGSMPVALPKKERKNLILKQVNIHTRLMFNDLVTLIDVSEDTIRRDLNELAEDGQVIRIKGGVMSAAYHYGHDSETYAQDDKLVIAHKALSLLSDALIVLIRGATITPRFVKPTPTALRAS